MVLTASKDRRFHPHDGRTTDDNQVGHCSSEKKTGWRFCGNRLLYLALTVISGGASDLRRWSNKGIWGTIPFFWSWVYPESPRQIHRIGVTANIGRTPRWSSAIGRRLQTLPQGAFQTASSSLTSILSGTTLYKGCFVHISLLNYYQPTLQRISQIVSIDFD